MHRLSIIISVLLFSNCFAQTDSEFVKEEMPEFPGKEDGLMKFINSILVYPESALNDRIEGRVYVKFVIDTNGKATNPTVKTGLRKDLDEEAIRIINEMPLWEPGTQNGKPIPVTFTMRIFFNLLNQPVLINIYNLAYKKQQASQFNQAIELYDRVINIYRKHQNALYNRAVCKISIGNIESACKDLEMVKSKDVEFVGLKEKYCK